MPIKQYLILGFIILFTTACVNQKVNMSKLPRGFAMQKDVKLPNDTKIVYYVPSRITNEYFTLKNVGLVETGRNFTQGLEAVMGTYFPNATAMDVKKPSDYALMLDLEPEWDFTDGKIVMTVNFQVLNAQQEVLMSDKVVHKQALGNIYSGNGFYNAAVRAFQMVSVKLLNKLKPDASKYSQLASTADIDPVVLANLEKPVSKGTAFFINARGDMLTAAHVLENCLVAKSFVEGVEVPATQLASSQLLDLAVLSSGQARDVFIPFRNEDELYLGEMITTIGYPLQGVLDDSPNITRGNVSSKKAIKGAKGQYQFSAPIQPGSSGGPIVSDSGEVLGIAVSTFSSRRMVADGVVPQNINFALDAKYMKQFLNKEGVPFELQAADLKADYRKTNNKVLPQIAQIACYQ